MKFYSEILKEFFNSEAECSKAENDELTRMEKRKEEEEKLLTEKKARAAEVEKAYKEIIKATEHYNTLLTKFIKDYKSCHFKIPNNELFYKIF